jgi:hypothetical protein
VTEVTMQGQAGPRTIAVGATEDIQLGLDAEQIVADWHGRFYAANRFGRLFSDGMGITSISASTFTTANLTATETPIIGVHNPSTSTVNVVVLQATLSVIQNALQATGCGGFVWASSLGNSAISTGSSPLNRRTLVASGSQAKGMTNVTPTGLTNALTVKFGSALNGGSSIPVAFLATQVGGQPQAVTNSVENFDGGLIVPPGGILTLVCGTTPVGHSAASCILWEEVPL